MFRDVHIGLRFSYESGEQDSPLAAYEEVQRVLDNHFKSRFIDAKGARYHVQVILCGTTPAANAQPSRVRRVRGGN